MWQSIQDKTDIVLGLFWIYNILCAVIDYDMPESLVWNVANINIDFQTCLKISVFKPVFQKVWNSCFELKLIVQAHLWNIYMYIHMYIYISIHIYIWMIMFG